MRKLLLGLTALLFVSPVAFAENRAVESKNGMVVCVSPDAADAGVAIMKKGGNAVDATVAVAFAMAVTYPPAGNIGGGGFMMVYPGPGKEPTCIEYRETAPAAVKADTFVNETSALTHKAVGVPGTVRGMEMAHKKFGKLPWKDVVAPSITLAADGFLLTPSMARSLNGILKQTPDNKEFQRCFGKPDGTPWKAGDRLIQKDLARTLTLIADNGADAFYTGELADLFEKEMKAGGGFVTKDDLKAYTANERKPVHGTYRGHDVYGPPPPSSGGICLVMMLNMMENFDLKKLGRWSPETTHLLAEASRRAFAERAYYLGDPAFTKIPDHLTSKEHGKLLAKTIDPLKATPSEKLARDIPLNKESEQTTHFSIVDKDGMAVANTYTLENSYGSRVVVRGAGYLLNNEMGDFNWKPGVTTTTGKIGTKPNQIAPGKRMLSSQTPTLVVKDGKLLLVTGSPGSRTIINTVFGIVVNVIDFDMDVQAAVDAPRFHQQWFPDEIRFEPAMRKQHPETLAKLKAMGHTLTEAAQGDGHSIWIDPKTGTRHGAADRRVDGKAAGY